MNSGQMRSLKDRRQTDSSEGTWGTAGKNSTDAYLPRFNLHICHA